MKEIRKPTNEELEDVITTTTLKLEPKEMYVYLYGIKQIKENERLHKSLEKQRHFYLGEIQRYEHYCKTTGIDELMGENERLQNIIKEVREYINAHKQKTIDNYEDEVEDYEIELWENEINDILEILDKEGKDNE